MDKLSQIRYLYGKQDILFQLKNKYQIVTKI